MSRLHYWSVECLTWCLTRIWGHLLIPTLLGVIFWVSSAHWMGWYWVHLLMWIGIFLVIGWFLTFMHWVRFYWDIFYTDPE